MRTSCSHGVRGAGAGGARAGDGGREEAGDDGRDAKEAGDGGGGDGGAGVDQDVGSEGYGDAGDGGGDGCPSDALVVDEGAVPVPEVEPGERSVRLDGRWCWAACAPLTCVGARGGRHVEGAPHWHAGAVGAGPVAHPVATDVGALAGDGGEGRRAGARSVDVRVGGTEGARSTYHSSHGRSAGWARGSQINPRVVHSTHQMSPSWTSQRTGECRVAT